MIVAELADFVPMAERAVSADPETLIRLRGLVGDGGSVVAGYVRLPYDVLAGRTIAAELAEPFDLTLTAADFLSWQAESGAEPSRQDARWLTGLPPRAGWQRIEVVPDKAIRAVVRSGALLAREASSRSGQQALLGAIVLTASSEGRSVDVPLGPLSALTRMGFLPRGGEAAVDVAPGWIRVAAAYGSTYVNDGNPLGLLSL
ncbi:MAG TPA: hypothetical protein VFU36_16520 [Jatrophihabitans sp.]|nr:hypothetical protein [Jatrophihabitans sp.]